MLHRPIPAVIRNEWLFWGLVTKKPQKDHLPSEINIPLVTAMIGAIYSDGGMDRARDFVQILNVNLKH